MGTEVLSADCTNQNTLDLTELRSLDNKFKTGNLLVITSKVSAQFSTLVHKAIILVVRKYFLMLQWCFIEFQLVNLYHQCKVHCFYQISSFFHSYQTLMSVFKLFSHKQANNMMRQYNTTTDLGNIH